MLLIPRHYVLLCLFFMGLFPLVSHADPDPNCYRKITEAANGIAGQCSEITTTTGQAKVVERSYEFKNNSEAWHDEYPNEVRMVAYSPVKCKLECSCEAQATALPEILCAPPGVLEGVKDGARAQACREAYSIPLPSYDSAIMIREIRKKGTTNSKYEVYDYHWEDISGLNSTSQIFDYFFEASAASAVAAARTCDAQAKIKAGLGYGPNGCSAACSQNKSIATEAMKRQESSMVCTKTKWEPIYPTTAACNPADDASYRGYEVRVQNPGEGMVQMRGGSSCNNRCIEKIRIPDGMTSVGVRLTAQAMPGHRFVQWTGGSCDGNKATSCAVSLSRAEEGSSVVTAVFEKISHVRVVIDAGGGTVTYNGDVPLKKYTDILGKEIAYEGDVPFGSVIRVSASAKDKNKFGWWDIQGLTNPCAKLSQGPSCSFEAKSTSYSIAAQFTGELPAMDAPPPPAPAPIGPLPNTAPAGVPAATPPPIGPMANPAPAPAPVVIAPAPATAAGWFGFGF